MAKRSYRASSVTHQRACDGVLELDSRCLESFLRIRDHSHRLFQDLFLMIRAHQTQHKIMEGLDASYLLPNVVLILAFGDKSVYPGLLLHKLLTIDFDLFC